MQVFILLTDMDYEGKTVEGVFATAEAAGVAQRKLAEHSASGREIVEYVDGGLRIEETGTTIRVDAREVQ